MHEPSAFDEYVEQGIRKGRMMGSHETLLEFGTKRLGPPSRRTKAALTAIEDLDRLHRMINVVLKVKSWKELLSVEQGNPMNEDPFLAAIRETPADRTVRLVYADWLEERADARGELIRIEEEMRELPVFSDRFWQLKPRRNELRAQSPADWLAAMSYGTECEPVFRHGWPDGWKERWRVIREFTERWHRRAMPDVGGRSEEIQATEAELRRTLPPSVREWVAFAHDVALRDDDMDESAFYVLRDPYQLKELAGHGAISLLLQAEGDYHWAVRDKDLVLDDPPVYGFHHDVEKTEDWTTFVPDERNPIADSVASFVLDYAMCYINGHHGFGRPVADETQLHRDLHDSFHIHCKLKSTDIFETANILVRWHHWTSGEYVEVQFFKTLPLETLPPWVLASSAHDEGDIPF